MNLFEVEGADSQDWFKVCPNADPVVFDNEPMSLYDFCVLFSSESDRRVVRDALNVVKTSRAFLISTLHATFPDNQAIPIIVREMLHKVPDSMLVDALALSHAPQGHRQIRFPVKIKKPIPSSLLHAFGLRPSESAWFDLLAANKSFIRLIAGQINPDDWKHLPHNKATLLKTPPKRPTASQTPPKQEGFLW